MYICYIRQAEQIEELLNEKQEKLPVILKKISCWYTSNFNKFKIEEKENNSICILPKIDNKKVDKLSNKLQKYLDNKSIKNVVISEELQNVIKLDSKINILQGKWLLQFFILDILKYICEKQKIEISRLNIKLLINDVNDFTLPILNLLAENIKTVSIVTNNIEKFKKIEEYLYNTYGITISVSNNKKKTLTKSKIIVNMDFNEEMLKDYSINTKAIIINIKHTIKKHSKKFNGININNFNIILNKNLIQELKEENLLKYFSTNALYESKVYRKDNFKNIKEELEKDKLIINNLIGNNGIIMEEEFLNN